MALTEASIKKFVRIRNESAFASNLQFQIDAQRAGFTSDDLGKAVGVNDWLLMRL